MKIDSMKVALNDDIKGNILIIDPCYIIRNDNIWLDICSKLSALRNNYNIDDCNGIEVNTDYGRFYIISTKYGDGTYNVKQRNKIIGKCSVDAGMLAVIPEDVMNKIENEFKHCKNYYVDLGVSAHVNGKFYAHDGDFSIGAISVKTNDEN